MRVVSLVPSLTEAIAVSRPGALVGATDWCVRPADLPVTRVRGTKNPDLAAIAALRPDLVVVNEEENRRADAEALTRLGVEVFVTDGRSVDGALGELDRLLARLDAPHREWLEQARRAWADTAAGPAWRVVVPVWQRPWVFLGADTYAGDVLRRLGLVNVLADQPERYPRLDPGALPAYDVVVLPDEPYRFTAADGPQAFAGRPYRLVDGQSLTWYGPAMIGAAARLRAQLA
ncbi:MAG: helical backbone metal receptor [Dermatophilaceae bacterium]